MKTDLGHIRARLRPRRGRLSSSGATVYRDTSERTATTLCGADVTEHDFDVRGAEKAARTGWNVCAECLAALRAQVGHRSGR